MEDMKDDLKQSLMDHHFEMVKQFFLMQVTLCCVLLLFHSYVLIPGPSHNGVLAT